MLQRSDPSRDSFDVRRFSASDAFYMHENMCPRVEDVRSRDPTSCEADRIAQNTNQRSSIQLFPSTTNISDPHSSSRSIASTNLNAAYLDKRPTSSIHTITPIPQHVQPRNRPKSSSHINACNVPTSSQTMYPDIFLVEASYIWFKRTELLFLLFVIFTPDHGIFHKG